MSYLQQKLAERKLPDLLTFKDGTPVTADRWEERRLELLSILEDEEYGHAPKGPFTVTGTITKKLDNEYARKATREDITIDVTSDEGSFSFDIVHYRPNRAGKYPAIVFLNFRPDTPDKYYPIEETIDRGFATFRIYYEDIIPDKNGDAGVALAFDREKYDWGQISMWAWAASRVRDYIETLDFIEQEQVAVVGHSRLGKTALWCGANDTRFKYTFVNCSGTSGDAITRGKIGETVEDICRAAGRWFCPAYNKYRNNEDNMPFDQHFLVAAVAPRYVVTGTAVEDSWADPNSQFLCDLAASPAYEMLGLKGFVCSDKLPDIGDSNFDGEIGFFMRDNAHFFSRHDWGKYMEFMRLKMHR